MQIPDDVLRLRRELRKAARRERKDKGLSFKRPSKQERAAARAASVAAQHARNADQLSAAREREIVLVDPFQRKPKPKPKLTRAAPIYRNDGSMVAGAITGTAAHLPSYHAVMRNHGATNGKAVSRPMNEARAVKAGILPPNPGVKWVDPAK